MSFVATFGKKISMPLMIVLPLIIVLMLVMAGFNPDPTNLWAVLGAIIWIILFLNSIIVGLSGYNLSTAFNDEIRKYASKGFPIASLEGFKEMQGKIQKVFSSSFFVCIIIFISLFTYLIAFIPNLILDENLLNELKITEAFIVQFVQIIALSLILIAIGIALLLQLPDRPALIPGALMRYFYPSTLPTQIDNFLSDTIFAFLDPITKMNWDEWSNKILAGLAPSYHSSQSSEDRLAIAREKMLLFAYLHLSLPLVITKKVVKSELLEIFSSEDHLESVMKGEGSRISWNVLLGLIRDVQIKAPEIFDVVDRLVIELRENLEKFKKNDNIWVTIASPSTVVGTSNPFRILVFMLNRDKNYQDKKRPVRIHTYSERFSTPVSYNIHLDETDKKEITADKLELISAGDEDVVAYISRYLQIGDAVWIQTSRGMFGNHLFEIRVETEDQGEIYGRSLRISLVRDIMFYVQNYGGQLSALGGIALPFIYGLIGLA